MSEFERRKEMFCALCRWLDLPVPDVSPALATDPCDFTSDTEVRLNLKEELVDAEYHVGHVFGHWLCDLHSDGNLKGLESCDQAADVIAFLLDKAQAYKEMPETASKDVHMELLVARPGGEVVRDLLAVMDIKVKRIVDLEIENKILARALRNQFIGAGIYCDAETARAKEQARKEESDGVHEKS